MDEKITQEILQWAKKDIKVPISKPGWYIVRNTPYGYQLLSGCFTSHENAIDKCKSKQKNWIDEPGWGHPELVKVELTVTKEEV